MAVTGQGLRIELPALQQRPYGLFIDVVPEIDLTDDRGVNRAAFGAKWMAPGAYEPILGDFNCDTPDDPMEGDGVVWAEEDTVAFSSWDLISCSAISEDPEVLRSRLKANARIVESEVLAEGATTNTPAGHLNLATDSTALSASASIGVAVSKVEAELAERISNSRGHIFVPILLLQAALDVSAVRVEGGELVSAAGHQVISDAGHGSDSTIFGTAGLGFYLSPVLNLDGGELERDIDIVTLWAQRFAVIVFNPEWSVRTAIS